MFSDEGDQHHSLPLFLLLYFGLERDGLHSWALLLPSLVLVFISLYFAFMRVGGYLCCLIWLLASVLCSGVC